MRAWHKVITAASPIVLSGLLMGCGDSDGGAGTLSMAAGGSVLSYSGTTGANDEWTVTQSSIFDAPTQGSFTVTNTSAYPPVSYTGTYEQVPSGFTKLTCTDASGCTGYSFQIADGVLAVWFTNPTTVPILAMVQGTCPTAATAAGHNFVRLPTLEEQHAGWVATSNGSGRSVMQSSSSLAQFDTTNVTFEPVIQAPVSEEGYSCQNGSLVKGTGASAVRVHMTESGIVFRTNGAVGGGYIGLAEPSTSYADLPTVLDKKEFLGIQWNSKLGAVVGFKGRYMTPGSTASYDEDKKAVPCVGHAVGCIFSRYVDVESGEPYGKPYMKTFVAELSDSTTVPATPYYGLFTTRDGETDGAIAMKDIAGKYVLVEAAKLGATGSSPGDPYNAIMVEK